MLLKAVEHQPDLAVARVGLGYVNYIQHDNDAALTEFNKAIDLDQNDFRPYHFRALLLLRTAGYTKESTPQIIDNLQKTIALAPDFAPAYGFLSVAYRQQDSTKPKSFDAAVRASTLEPANYNFMVDIGDALLAINHDQDAIKLLDRMQKSARAPSEKELVESFGRRLAAHQNQSVNKETTVAAPPISGGSEDSTQLTNANGQRETQPTKETQEGIIQEVICAASSATNVRFAILGKTLSLAATDTSKITLRVSEQESNLSAMPCEQWKGKKAKIAFVPSPDEKAPAEIISVDFP